MSEGPGDGRDRDSLRRGAEAAVGASAETPSELLAADEVRQILHELRVHQVELEMQNDELRRTRTELELTQARYMDLFNRAPIGYIIFDEDGLIREANLAAATLLGVPADKLVGRPVTGFIAPEDQDPFYLLTRRLLVEGRPENVEVRLVRTDAPPPQVRIDAISATDAGGRPAYRAALTDITERSVAEEALRHSQRLLNESQRLGRVGGWEFDIASGVQTWTDEVYRIHEIEPGAEMGPDGRPTVAQGISFYTPASRPIIERAVEATIQRGEPFDLELEITTAKANRRAVRAIGVADPDGRRVNGFFQDITDRKAAAEALRESRLELEEAQRLAHVGSWTWVAATDRNEWSDELLRIFGLEPGRPAPTTVEEPGLYDAALYERLELAYARTSQTGRPFEIEYDIVRPDGTVRHLVEQGEAVRDATGDVVGLFGIARDITERKAAEQEILRLNATLEQRVIERTEKLETAVKELETFNYSASHDLRAPLRAINGYASLLERHQGAALDETSRRYLGLIETASERMGLLLELLLDYSRLGQDGIRAEPVPPGPLVARLHVVYGERFAAAGGRLEFAGSPAVPVADPHLLERILDNLVGNALTYRRPDVPPLVTVSAERHGDRVTVSVADNGIGIPPEHQERIFALFTRLHREDEYPGTGIGLSIVRKAARLMGTDVMVASVEGEGSTFSLELPAAAR